MGVPNEFNLWVLFSPAPDLPGKWIGHCLDIDVVSQGDSREQAADMMSEAILMAVVDDLVAGRDPLKRPSAPDEEWEKLHWLQRNGRLVEQADARSKLIAKMFHVSLGIEQERRDPEVRELPKLVFETQAMA